MTTSDLRTAPALLRQLLGPTGVWTFRFEQLNPGQAADAAMEIERLGFPSVWFPEVGGTEAMTLAGHLLHHTYSLTVANGIARLTDRSAGAAAAAHRYLQTISGGRHVLGLGLGGPLANGPSPVEIMAEYVDGVGQSWAGHRDHDGTPPVWCLAAYNERMTRLAAETTGAIHTYLIDPEHTAATRALLGENPVIAAEMAVVLTDDRDEARAVGRAHVARYLGGRSHQRKFAALGFTEEDLAAGGSDRLVDRMVVHGADAIAARVSDHRAAGADHVAIQVLGTADLTEDLRAWALLADLVL